MSFRRARVPHRHVDLDDLSHITDPKEKKRIQNRNAQRSYRMATSPMRPFVSRLVNFSNLLFFVGG